MYQKCSGAIPFEGWGRWLGGGSPKIELVEITALFACLSVGFGGLCVFGGGYRDKGMAKRCTIRMIENGQHCGCMLSGVYY